MNKPFAAIAAIAVFGAVASPAAAATAAAQAWYGSYSWERVLPRDNGIVPSVDYALKIDDSGCTVEVTGYQSDEHILCSARIDGPTLKIGFVSYADGRSVNQYGVSIYRKKGTLFTLTRGKSGLRTTWGALHPDGVARTGKFLRRD